MRSFAVAPVIAFLEPFRPCPACGRVMPGRRTSACSDRCRAAESRRRVIPLPVAEATALRASLTRALPAVEGSKAAMARYGAEADGEGEA
jgi:predicted nucleic acid-binding Zn ribbon protein